MSNESNLTPEPDLPDRLPARLDDHLGDHLGDRADECELEARLRRFSPVPSAVNRDAVIYQAGWAAAEASATRGVHWLWSATAGALAASLLMLLVLRPSNLIRSPDGDQGIATAEVSQQKSKPRMNSIERRPHRYVGSAPLLVMRERALHYDFDILSSLDPLASNLSADDIADDGLPMHEVSNRQLLRELLPDSDLPNSPRETRPPFWSKWNFGETT